ncbi:MAG: NADP-dependent malic enzyme [Alphaproteobacteria bacterium]|nr:NADP-dependent malic enzyme [Alphaproteobacteria bacterium]MDP6623161.1 NADP-dependent malic enzyme [Alphaproteobacteria bacterium]
MDNQITQQALDYHRRHGPGKLTVTPTKPLGNQRDLALAYSPGVAAVCDAIVADSAAAFEMTVRGNLVAVISNGSAVLGLGNIGPLASKPVMEGKAVLFKKFAGIDVFDLEIDETDPERLVEIIAALEPTFGAINLEDIKAPDCFVVERELRRRMNIPVFHDDQHGTAIVASAALSNGLAVVGKDIGEIKMVSTGGGAAGIACLDLMIALGLRRENVVLVDHLGVIFEGRSEDMTDQKAAYAVATEARTLDEVISGADVFLGLSAPGVLLPEMVARMAERPLILALANPTPEILPEDAQAVRPDAVMATGRSDYPNQVNNVLCFPFLFRGALDVGATAINEEMKLACTTAIAELAKAESSEVVARAYSGAESLIFGPDYLIPKPFDPRLIVEIAPAVAKAAMQSGVATRPIADFDQYRDRLSRFVFRSGTLMKPVFDRAKQNARRLAYAEGEDPRVLRAIQVVLDEGLARPTLVGRPDVIAAQIEELGLRLKPGVDFELVNPNDNPSYEEHCDHYYRLMERKGVSPEAARTIVRTNTTVIASLLLARGQADAMICGTYGQYDWHLRYVLDVIGKAAGVTEVAALSVLILDKGTYFFCDAYVKDDPTAEEMVEATIIAAEEVRRFGIEPKVAFISHSNFGSADTPSARKVQEAVRRLAQRRPDFEFEGEMHADAAIDENLRRRLFPNSRLEGQANLLVLPSLEAANNAFNLLKVLGDGLPVGPILLGAAKPAHIVTPSITARGIVNMSAISGVDAQLDVGVGGTSGESVAGDDRAEEL